MLSPGTLPIARNHSINQPVGSCLFDSSVFGGGGNVKSNDLSGRRWFLLTTLPFRFLFSSECEE